MSGKWHLGTDDPTRHGFEQFYGTLISAATFWDQAGYLRRPQGSTQRGDYSAGAVYGTDALTDYGIWIFSKTLPRDSRPAVVLISGV